MIGDMHMIIESKYFSLEDKVYHELEEEILTGKLKRGTALTEISLSKRLGVSRTPIRSAIRRLTEEGLIETVANRGSVVVGITEEDMLDIYRVRVRLEGLASKLAAENISKDGLDTLTEAVELSEFYINKKDTEKLKELDSVFHETVYKEANNRWLAKTLSELHKKIRAYRKLSLTVPGRLETSVAEHRQILDAIARGDAAEADRLTSLHIEAATDNMMLAFENAKKEEKI